MHVGSIRNVGSTPQSSQKRLSDTTSIDQKIEQLKKQLKRVKADKKLSAEERDKRIENIQKKIERLEQQRERKMSAEKTEQRQQSKMENVVSEGESHLIDVLA